MLEHYDWSEKYRPKTVADTILPDDLKKVFQSYVDGGNVQNLLLTGGPGIGKTTVAMAMLEELGCDYTIINGSLHGNIDTLRNEITDFASSVSLTGGRKYVILDEADYLNANTTQPALRNFIQEYSRNCGFILTCNMKKRIIKPLHSRTTVIEFTIPKESKPKLAAQFFKRTEMILNQEQVPYDKQVLAAVIQKFFPDWRRVLNELQRYSKSGAIDSGILTDFQKLSVTEVIGACKAKDFDAIRRWVHDNADIEQHTVFRSVYDAAMSLVDKRSLPELIVIIADYQYKDAFVADHEINLVAFFVEMMMRCEFL